MTELRSDDSDRLAVYAAENALRAHLDEVLRRLPLAARLAESEPEHVHQLRVATRRAAAVLHLFDDFVSPRARRRVQNWLKSVRRAAGEARDLDVLIARKVRAGCERDVLRALRDARVRAQRAIAEIHEAADGPFERDVETLLGSLVPGIKARGTFESTLGEFARARIRDMSIAFFARWPETADDIEGLHALRVSAKSMRYALDLLLAAFLPSLAEPVAAEFRALQTQLGDLNDHATAVRRLEERLDHRTVEPGLAENLEAEISDERGLLAQAVERFQVDWPKTRKNDLCARFEAMLVPIRRASVGSTQAAPSVRRFRLTSPPARSILGRGESVSQVYLPLGEGLIVARRTARRCVLTAHGDGDIFGPRWRVEALPLWAFERLELAAGSVRIDKTRYALGHKGRRFQIDRFHGVLEGLWIFECKFSDARQAARFSPPHWAEGAIEVTDDARYRSSSLALNGVPH
ncbi:MAG: CHAD domain-containing protein [Deltaproteobacteria bacterium]|nr:CHAD domain-containing protein [Deltaproteobacteria bacterium]